MCSYDSHGGDFSREVSVQETCPSSPRGQNRGQTARFQLRETGVSPRFCSNVFATGQLKLTLMGAPPEASGLPIRSAHAAHPRWRYAIYRHSRAVANSLRWRTLVVAMTASTLLARQSSAAWAARIMPASREASRRARPRSLSAPLRMRAASQFLHSSFSGELLGFLIIPSGPASRRTTRLMGRACNPAAGSCLSVSGIPSPLIPLYYVPV